MINLANGVDGVVAVLVAQLDVGVRCCEEVWDHVQIIFVRVPLDIAQKDVRSPLWRCFMISSLHMGQHLELMKRIQMLEVVQIKTRCCLPLLIDMKVHYHLCKMMLGQCYKQRDMAHLLLSHTLVNEVWHPYKYAVTTTDCSSQYSN